jgi:hypothetical protein
MMRAVHPSDPILIDEIAPLGDVALVPSAVNGQPDAELMAAALRAQASDSTAETLTRLRHAYPHAPLSMRMAALAAIMRR